VLGVAQFIADFFKKSPEIAERVFACVATISGLVAATIRNSSPNLAIDFTILAIGSAVLGVFSYVRRSRHQKQDKDFSISWTMIVLTAGLLVVFIGGLILSFVVSSKSPEETRAFRVLPTILFSDDRKSGFGPYVVFRDERGGYYATAIHLFTQFKITNLQNFSSRIDSFSLYQGNSEMGPWVKLCPVPSVDGYITEISKDATSGGLLKPLGDSIDYTTALSIGAHDSRIVFAAWACPTGKVCEGKWIKVEIGDDEGVSNAIVSDLSKPEGVNMGYSAFRAEQPFDNLHNKTYEFSCKRNTIVHS
jgi:hypothetical protein